MDIKKITFHSIHSDIKAEFFYIYLERFIILIDKRRGFFEELVKPKKKN